MSTDLSSKDLMKPKKVLTKFLYGLSAGGGAIGQEMIHTKIKEFLPNVSADILSFVEWLVANLAKSTVTNEYLDNALTGMSAGSAKDLVKSLYSRFSGNGLFANKSQTSTNTTISTPKSSSEQYLI